MQIRRKNTPHWYPCHSEFLAASTHWFPRAASYWVPHCSNVLSTCQTWFRQKYPMLPDKARFRFVFAKCVFGCMCDISHFVTHEVITAKPVQIILLTQKLQNLCWFAIYFKTAIFLSIYLNCLFVFQIRVWCWFIQPFRIRCLCWRHSYPPFFSA